MRCATILFHAKGNSDDLLNCFGVRQQLSAAAANFFSTIAIRHGTTKKLPYQ